METSSIWKPFFMGCLFLVLLTSCAPGTQDPTPEPTFTLVPPTNTLIPPTSEPVLTSDVPVPTTCGEVDGI